MSASVIGAALRRLARSENAAAATGLLLLSKLVANDYDATIELDPKPTETRVRISWGPDGGTATETLRIGERDLTDAMIDLFELVSSLGLRRRGSAFVLSSPTPGADARARMMTPEELPSLQLLLAAGLVGEGTGRSPARA